MHLIHIDTYDMDYYVQNIKEPRATLSVDKGRIPVTPKSPARSRYVLKIAGDLGASGTQPKRRKIRNTRPTDFVRSSIEIIILIQCKIDIGIFL